MNDLLIRLRDKHSDLQGDNYWRTIYNERYEAADEIERLRAALTDARNKLRQYGEWREPSANLLIDLADEVDAALSQQVTGNEK